MFYKIVLKPSRIPVAEQFSKIDAATSHIDHPTAGIHVLNMQHGKASRVFLEVRNGVYTGIHNPEQIHLHGYQLWVRFRQQDIVGDLAVGGCKFKVVIVIAHLQAGTLARFPGTI